MSGHNAPATGLHPHELVTLYDDPKYGSDDDLKIYMSMRDNGPEGTRQHYLERLNNERQKRLKHEIERITKLRVKFFANPNKKTITTAHEARRREWKEEAKANQAEYIKDLDERTKILDGAETQGDDVTTKRKKLLNEYRIVKAIAQWPKDESPPLDVSPVVSSDKPDYGLKACIMHFVKGGGGHTHTHRHKKVVGAFPNQKIAIDYLLTKSEDNPLNEDCPQDRLRYFHLPTNNMAWIEVSSYLLGSSLCAYLESSKSLPATMMRIYQTMILTYRLTSMAPQSGCLPENTGKVKCMEELSIRFTLVT
jgi:hypothetical protein